MQYFAVVFTAIVALSVASPVELEERQDFINTIIEMVGDLSAAWTNFR